MIARASEVKTHTFYDDTIRTTKYGNIVKPDPILHETEEPTVAKFEQWAAGVGGASAANLQETFDFSERHVQDTRVVIHCKIDTETLESLFIARLILMMMTFQTALICLQCTKSLQDITRSI